MPLQSDLFFMCASVREIYDADSVMCLQSGAQGETLRIVAADGLDAEVAVGVSVPADAGVTGWVHTTGLPVHVPDLREDPRRSVAAFGWKPHEPRVLLGAPLADAGGRVTGVLVVMDPHAEVTPGHDLELLAVMATQVAELTERSPREAPLVVSTASASPTTRSATGDVHPDRTVGEPCPGEPCGRR